MNYADKVVPLEELARRMEREAARGLVTGLAHGCFDLLHLGHVRYLARARARCDFLAVTVTPDSYLSKGPHRPVFPEGQRAEVLAALGMVDAVAVSRWPTAAEIMDLLRPARYFKGAERRRELAEADSAMSAEARACRVAGGTVEFIDDLVFSSTSIAMRYYGPLLREGWTLSS